MYLTIANIEHACLHTPICAEVRCRVDLIGGYVIVHLNITARSVDIIGVAPFRDAPPIDVARVLVAPDLVDATRRLFGLVGTA